MIFKRTECCKLYHFYENVINTMKNNLLLTILVVVLLSFQACKESQESATTRSDGFSENIEIDLFKNEEEIIIPIEQLVFTSNELNVSVGSTFMLDYTIVPENANYTEIRAEISNDFIEMGDDFAFYSDEAGDSEILFYQDDRLLGSCVIHAALIEIEDLTITEAPEEVFVGDTVDLAFSLFPENATNIGLNITSSDPSIAEVVFDERGTSVIQIIGKSTGKAKVTITTPSGKTYTHKIRVKDVEPTEIKLAVSNPNQRIEVGTPISLNVLWQPENTTIKELTWTSSNRKVIKVDSTGNLESVGVGTAELTAKHKSGLSASITITVEPTLVTKVEILTTRDIPRELHIGSKFTITTSVSPENATDKTLSYSSSNESIAKVTNNGVVTATGVGTATITATSVNGAKSTMSITVSPAPQKFKITWFASLKENNHVGNDWSKSFTVNGESFRSGSTIILDPGYSFTVRFNVVERDKYPDTGSYSETITYTDNLCKNGYTISKTISVREDRGNYAYWNLKITITPIK